MVFEMFASPASANVILAKARAMYGSHLKAQNYLDLLGCHSVSEVASYLKNNTAYATVLADINESTIHRGYLETLLRRKQFEDYASLSRYDMTVGMHLSRYLIQRGEIEQIMHCLQLMSAGRTEEFFFAMPQFFASHTALDLVAMSRAKSFEGLTETLANTPYQAILQQFAPLEDGLIRVTEIENALYARLIRTLFAIVDQTGGELHEQLISLCGAQVDAQNVTRILRMKRYFHASPDIIRANLLPGGRAIPPKLMEKMLQAASPDEVMAIFRTTAVGRRIPKAQKDLVHDLHLRAPYFTARHHIHYSIHPMVVMISYIILSDVELDDITNIIEGIRYGLPVEEIKPMLVLVDH